MKKRIAYFLILFFLIIDFSYSFYQYYHTPLLGDVADVVLPTKDYGYYNVLKDPFGFDVIIKDKHYANPNRFFAHKLTSEYFLTIPILLQNFISPINSIYLASAIIKLLTHLLIVYLLTLYITKTSNILNIDFVTVALLITPFFQTFGYNRYMGIIDNSVIYTFFYALPLGFLLYFYLPFYNNLFNNKPLKFNYFKILFYILFIVFLSFNGPLLTGIVLIVNTIILLFLFITNYKKKLNNNYLIYRKIYTALLQIPPTYLFLFILFNILSLYSLYISKNNTLNCGNSLTIFERYLRIPIGIYYLLTQKIGNSLLIFSIIINYIIIKKYYWNNYAKKIKLLIKWIILFTIIYILLLPLGGYREYRENIIRYDTVLPITISLIYLFGLTSFFIIKQTHKKINLSYITYIFIILSIYTIADKTNESSYICERNIIEEISKSKEKIILLNSDCPVMDWEKVYNKEFSKKNAKLFKYWNITKTEKLYYYKK